MKPAKKPFVPHFSSGPCAKRPGWKPEALSGALVGRSHRSKEGKARLKDAIEKTRKILGIPADYRIGIMPASDTGAVEMAMWSLLGLRGVDMLNWESFGDGWVTDATKQLKLQDVRVLKAPYGEIPDLAQVDKTRDVVFTWNGTTSGACVPNADWIAADREGLTICDATSAAFAMDLAWDKLDATTFSWQKVLGGEAAHGMLVLSPRAIKRLETYKPAWPMPKLFRMTSQGKVNEAIFVGETINTPSMLCVEDYLDALAWAEIVGGRAGLMKRSRDNLAAIEAWVEKSNWAAFLTERKAIRSWTSICLVIADPWFKALSDKGKNEAAKAVVAKLEKEGVAFDCGHYRDAPAGLRIWGGATVETADIEALLPWIDWAYGEIKASYKEAA